MPALHEASAISSTSGRITKLPILILNVHTNCNCRCTMCDIWKRDTNDQIRANDLERHRASLENLGVRRVVLTGGEPLLHNDLATLCNFFRSQNIELTLLTTGVLLQKRSEEVALLFDDVILSIDGPPEIHDAIRRINGASNLIHKGIAAVRRHNPALPISCRTTVQKANHRHLRQTINTARAMGLDSISFLPVDLTSQAFNRALIWPGEKQNEIALTIEEVKALEDEVEQLIAEYHSAIRHRYILESEDKLRNIPRRFREHLGELAPRSPMCNAPWVSAVVEVDGSVRPCFFHRTIGTIASASLEEVINCDAARNFRDALDIETNTTCQRCVCSLNYRGS
ncbi:MAG TPA: radical SAM protein [Edaphobacter sp.]|jgi:MoaA/NifB/PqqE/SkfB family radical SAM enzyme|nr:radical SAM protein [Edaphobacter sp.]